jgi:DNA repair photolyase
MELDATEFEKRIYVKQGAEAYLPQEIARKYSYESAASGGMAPEHIAIGTATDPYQPAEREYGVTRACLEELEKREGLSISITTKSNQILRDLELLRRIAEKSALFINMTVSTTRTRLARLLEPRAPQPGLRLAAMKQLREAGISAGVFASPLLPGITDREGDLESVAEAAHEAGAQWFTSGVLFLTPSSSKVFMPFLQEKFPRLVEKYKQWYTRNTYAPEEYRKKVAERVARLRAKYGFHVRPWDEMKRPVLPVAQLRLNLDGTEYSGLERAMSCTAG